MENLELWAQVQKIKNAEQQVLASLGELYLRLDEVLKAKKQLLKNIKSDKGKLEQIQNNLRVALEAIAVANGASDGNYVFDFDNKTVTAKNNGSIPNSSDR